MPVKQCAESGCPELIPDEPGVSRCLEHTGERNREIRRVGKWGKEQRRTRRWKNLREEVFERDDWTCQVCFHWGKIADHIVAVEDGGEMFDLLNLQTLCQVCHGKKTKKEVESRNYV